MPSISVVIPSYNRATLLTRALDSVYAQTRPPDEVIVVDDGSTDGTSKTVAKHFPDVQLIRQKNLGVSAARNAGISAASGQWIALLDSDDTWLAKKLARQMSALEARPGFRLIHCDEIWVRNGVRVNPMHKHRKQGGYIFQRCLELCCISPSAAMIHRCVFNKIGYFDTGLPACEDYELWLRICAREPVLYVSEPLVRKYGGHEDQLSRRHWGMDRFRVRALENILASDWLSPEDRRAAEQALVKKATILARGAQKRGHENLVNTYRRIAQKYQRAVIE